MAKYDTVQLTYDAVNGDLKAHLAISVLIEEGDDVSVQLASIIGVASSNVQALADSIDPTKK